jgi:hypothetical protein
LGRDSWLGIDHCADATTGTSATQAGSTSEKTPSSIACSGRLLPVIENSG